MLETALLFLSRCWQLLVCFLATARSGSAALSLPRKPILSVLSRCIPHPRSVSAPLRARRCLPAGSSAPQSSPGLQCRGCGRRSPPAPEPGAEHPSLLASTVQDTALPACLPPTSPLCLLCLLTPLGTAFSGSMPLDSLG